MRSRLIIIIMFLLVQTGNEKGEEKIKKYFNETVRKVKAETEPKQKREILNNSLQTMSKALNKVESTGLVSKEDRADIDRLKADLQEKQDELAGLNGYERVADTQLNAFSDYVVQDMEQAEKTISISLVSALLIVIIIILLV